MTRYPAGPPVVLLLVATLAVLLAGGCVGGTARPAGGTGAGSAGAGSAATQPTAGGTATVAPDPGRSGSFNGTDVAWLQLMIALDERALPLLDMAAGRAAEPAVRRLAARVRESHRAQLLALRGLRERSGAPQANPHEGHDMPGMVTAAELRAMAAASGPALGRLFARSLRGHLEQSARLSRAERMSGSDRGTTRLATEIVRTSTGHLGQLDRLGSQTGRTPAASGQP